MSKQIAQTVGDKKIAALIALLAAFAVLATLATQWGGASANVTGANFVVTNDDPAPVDGFITPNQVVTYTVTWTVAGSDHVGSTVIAGTLDTDLVVDSVTPPPGPQPTCTTSANTFSCTYANPLTVGSTGTLVVTAHLLGTAANGVALGAAAVTVDDQSAQAAQAATITTTALTQQNAVLGVAKSDSVDPVAPGASLTYTITVTNTGPIAATATVTDTLPAAFASVTSATTTSGTCSVSSLTVTCSNISLAATTGTATITIVGVTKANPGVSSMTNTANLTSVVNTLTGPTASGAQTTSFVNGTADSLVHVGANGVIENVRDHENNVIGYTHTVCALNDAVNGIWPNVFINDGSDNFQITTISGTANVQVPVATANVDCDGDGFADDSRLTWYSTAPGEQNVTVVDDGGNTLYGFSGTGASTVPLVKEWNTLAPTWILSSTNPLVITQGTAGGPDTLGSTFGTANLDGTTVSGSMTFNAATGTYSGNSSTYNEYPIATHTNSGGTQVYVAYGAKVTFTRASSSTCGAVVLRGTPGTDYIVVSGPTTLDQDSDVLVVTSLGVAIPFRFEAATGVDPCTGATGNTKVNIQVDYPILLGSDQPPAPALETLQVNWSGALPYKKVFLAWAGQRIILEQDWRIPAGDVDDASTTEPGPVGSCPWGARATGLWTYFDVTYVKGSGPGNFVEGLNDNAGASDLQKGRVVLNGSDQATVYNIDANDAIQDNTGTSTDDVPLGPQDSCISRVLYESEDPGEVDIEAMVASVSDTIYPAVGERAPILNNATKVAFVVYYMKINTVNVSLVTQVSKPSHNSSILSDYAPGNPWDASKDDADNAADWNVSKDILVRGRVTGWFLNSNPSGRAADTSNPLNVLPANRWVMPQDWPLLAGGPADPADGTDAVGTAEQFRPYYDIMFAPNNTRNLALANPDGQSIGVQLTSVATGSTGTGRFVASGNIANSPIRVASCSDLPAGRAVFIATQSLGNVIVCASGFLFVTGPTATPLAVGTGIFAASGVPFEGPFSPLDILGWAFEGKGGAALSNIDIDNIRDTAVDDGDVDMWDAPMPPAAASVAIRGTGFLKAVYKDEVYYVGVPNTVAQIYPNPFYFSNIPDSPFIPATVAGGGVLWDSWGNDGPGGNGDGAYRFWRAVLINSNSQGIGETLSTADNAELALLRTYFQDGSITRDLVVYTDNHGEFMVTANGDFKTDLTACATNVLAGGKHCKPGDKVGTGSISATVDYPDFDKHFPVLSNTATVTWTWGGYKDVTVENGETDQYKYIVFHAMDRDGFCSPLGTAAVLLHSVLGIHSIYGEYSNVFDDVDTAFTAANLAGSTRYNNDPNENVDFLIDSGEGIIIGNSGGAINDGKQFATGVPTFSVSENDPATTGIKEFPLSSLAASGQTDECQAWIKVSNSLLGVLNVLAIAHDDEGNIGFDKIIDLTNTTSYTLNFRWSLITWAGADNIPVSDAIKGTGTSGKNPGGNDISASVTAIYGWDAAAQQWLGYFPSGVNVPGANDLTALKTGQAYWIAITGPSSVTWTIASNVN